MMDDLKQWHPEPLAMIIMSIALLNNLDLQVGGARQWVLQKSACIACDDIPHLLIKNSQ